MRVLFALSLFCLISATHAGGYKSLGVKTIAVESDHVLIVGETVQFRDCDGCAMRKMKAAPDMRIKLADGYIVPPQMPRPATVSYRVADEVVVRVSYW